MSKHLKKIEEELLPEMEAAAIKGNMNRVIAALQASLVELVEGAKATNAALNALTVAKARKPAKKPVAKKPRAKKVVETTEAGERENG